MEDHAMCAKCGEMKDLYNSVSISGIKQPRMCSDCVRTAMVTNDYEINDKFWLIQLGQLGDTKSLELLIKGHVK